MDDTQPTLAARLIGIQRDLKAPKNQENKFGGYRYRSCEDILEALKPHLAEAGLLLLIEDDVVPVGDRVYVKATVTLKDSLSSSSYQVTAFAREELAKKGMDASQITGSASSYARKYALNGLFLIDDTKDADTNEHRAQSDSSPEPRAPRAPRKPRAAADAVAEQAAQQLGAIGEQLISDEDFQAIVRATEDTGTTPAVALRLIASIVGHPVKHPKDLTADEGAQVSEKLTRAMLDGINPFTGEALA